MNFALLGMNFRSAPLELREQVSFATTQVRDAVMSLVQRLPETEVALVSTCNRTELYLAGTGADMGKVELMMLLAESAGVTLEPDADEHFYHNQGLATVEHLMSVSASLDSMVVGETEILGQVKQAYSASTELQPDSRYLHRLFQGAIRTAKRVHTETDICRGRVSVSSVAVEFAQKVFSSLSSKTVIILGAGETAELTLKSLVDHGVKELLVLNRSIERAQAIAGRHGGKAVAFDELDRCLPRADIVISCTSAPHCVIKVDAVRNAVAARNDRPMFFIDIAVPRDIEKDVAELDNVYLYHIDDLGRVAEQNLEKRKLAVSRAWEIVREEAAGFSSVDSGIGLLMGELDELAREIKEEELMKAFRKQSLEGLSDRAREDIRLLVHRSINKILGPAKSALGDAAKNGRWEKYSAVTRDLFKLGGGGDDE